jgi:hypothetical protein
MSAEIKPGRIVHVPNRERTIEIFFCTRHVLSATARERLENDPKDISCYAFRLRPIVTRKCHSPSSDRVVRLSWGNICIFVELSLEVGDGGIGVAAIHGNTTAAKRVLTIVDERLASFQLGLGGTRAEIVAAFNMALGKTRAGFVAAVYRRGDTDSGNAEDQRKEKCGASSKTHSSRKVRK